jgi:hypothetical protein
MKQVSPDRKMYVRIKLQEVYLNVYEYGIPFPVSITIITLSRA